MLEGIANDEARLSLAREGTKQRRFAPDKLAANRLDLEGQEIFGSHQVDEDRRPPSFLALDILAGQLKQAQTRCEAIALDGEARVLTAGRPSERRPG